MMNTGTAAYFGDDHRSDDAGLRKDHVISLGADTNKAFSFEDSHQLLVRDGAKLWHGSEEAVDSPAAR